MADETCARFNAEGVVVLRGAFPAEEAVAMREVIWRHIEARTDVRLGDSSTWASDRNFGLSAIASRDVFAPVVTNSRVQHALEAIFGAEEWQGFPYPTVQVLLSFPTPPPWVMPSGWHIDFGFETPTWPTFAVKLFAFLDDVEPEGGGTLVLAGSHRLVERFARSDGAVAQWPEEELLRRDPWLDRFRLGGTETNPQRDLLGVRHESDGIPVQAVELCGQPGDVAITHIHVFHSPAPNVGRRPRQMLGVVLHRESRLDGPET